MSAPLRKKPVVSISPADFAILEFANGLAFRLAEFNERQRKPDPLLEKFARASVPIKPAYLTLIGGGQ